ncbi:MAG TPA: phosphoribosyltransferase family protein [Gemmatimonadaceae bacterium]|nr:phosphoribosyltransferase family protein [Gemmatimonadaceae bacterium]
MHALKYEGWVAVAEEMARRMTRTAWPADVVAGRSAIIPVPLSSRRLRERGFNQSELLAVSLAKAWHIPVWNHTLERTRKTRSQTELTPAERLSNVAGAFRVPKSEAPRVRGAHIVLVDDVITTGATLCACAKALFASGALTISYSTFGRAPASGDRVSTGERHFNGN